MAKKDMSVFNAQRTLINKAASSPEHWEAFKQMLLNLRLAVAVEPRPDAAVRHLARTWFNETKYEQPICKATLLKLMTLKKANSNLEEMITLYIDLEEGKTK